MIAASLTLRGLREFNLDGVTLLRRAISRPRAPAYLRTFM